MNLGEAIVRAVFGAGVKFDLGDKTKFELPESFMRSVRLAAANDPVVQRRVLKAARNAIWNYSRSPIGEAENAEHDVASRINRLVDDVASGATTLVTEKE